MNVVLKNLCKQWVTNTTNHFKLPQLPLRINQYISTIFLLHFFSGCYSDLLWENMLAKYQQKIELTHLNAIQIQTSVCQTKKVSMLTIWINLVQDLYYNLVSSAENCSLKRYFRYFFLVDNGLLMFRRSAKFQYREES